jgi:hypothetical protein
MQNDSESNELLASQMAEANGARAIADASPPPIWHFKYPNRRQRPSSLVHVCYHVPAS